MENKMATPLEKSVFWCIKETVSQYDGQNPEPVMFENLVIHFDQEKFERLLSEGSPVFHARKHRKISVAKALEQKPTLTGRIAERASSQLLSASIEAKHALRKASQIPCETS